MAAATTNKNVYENFKDYEIFIMRKLYGKSTKFSLKEDIYHPGKYTFATKWYRSQIGSYNSPKEAILTLLKKYKINIIKKKG